MVRLSAKRAPNRPLRTPPIEGGAPRAIAKGSDGQLIVRTSESMNLLYAAHNNKGKQNIFMAKTKNIGDSISTAISVNSEKDEVSAHGENGPKLKQGKGRGIFAAWVG